MGDSEMTFPEKLVLIGVDGAISDLVEMLIKDGKLPNIGKIAEKGFFGRVLAPYPTVTPNNWTSLATGAWAGTTGIADYHVHHAGDPLHIIYSGFNTNECSAEYLWNAAERAGKRVLLMKYSASWPPTVKNGIQVNGCGPNVTDEVHEICPENLFTNMRGYPLANQVDVKPSDSDPNTLTTTLRIAPHPKKRIFDARRMGLTATVPTVSELDLKSYEPFIFQVLLPQVKGQYRQIVISRSARIEDQVAALTVGQWSQPVAIGFDSKDKKVEGTIKFKLIELSEDAKRFRLYSTHVMPNEGWTKPTSIGPDLVKQFGSFIQRPGWEGIVRGWTDDATFLEQVEYQNKWMADASVYLMRKYGYDLFFLQTHSPDYAHHVYMTKAEPLTNPDEQSRTQTFGFLTRVYVSVDQLVGTITEAVDEKTLIAIVSDHGAQSSFSDVNLYDILAEGGLLYRKDEDGVQVIDWSRTKATPHRQCHIYVNLKGREPHGIVEPGEYEEVREKIIELLHDYKDKKTGRNPFSLVLKREDARILGLHGQGIGDLIFAVNPGLSHEHGRQLSTVKFGQFGCLDCLLVMAGPGIQKGAQPKPTRWLIDIAPTIAHLLSIPTPRDADGSIMYEILEDPDARLRETENLRREAENWRNAYEKMQGLTHMG